MKIYLDTSAAVKLVVAEPESAALVAYLEERAAADFVSSNLFETELRRAARRRGVAEEKVSAVVEMVNLAEASRAVLRLAAAVGPASLRSLDAIHLATALREDVDLLVAYDERLAHAAAEAGLTAVAPS